MQMTSAEKLEYPRTPSVFSFLTTIKNSLFGRRIEPLEEHKYTKRDVHEPRDNEYGTNLSTEQAHAIAGMTSMLAHDMRRPFAKLSLMLEALPKLTEEQINKYSKDVDLSIRKVESMLSDVMEFSRDAKYTLTPENVLNVLSSSIKDISRCHPEKKVVFHYDLEILNLINMDEYRLSRVFDNIIGNAFDIMPDEKAFMWFVAKSHENQAEIIIGNSGNHIPEDHLDKIFDSKFTHGKKEWHWPRPQHNSKNCKWTFWFHHRQKCKMRTRFCNQRYQKNSRR